MPCNDNEGIKEYLIVATEDIKLVSDYSNLSFNEVLELDCLTYKLLLKDAFICKMKGSEQGREYLEQCWILTQTSPDRKKLRDNFGKER